MPIGRYTVAATLQGFKTEQASGNVVETDRATIVPFTLSIGALTDTVVVTGDVPIVTQSNITATTRVRREEFEKIPVGRNYQALIGTAPGVVGTGNVNAMGALTSSNLFIVDSVDTTDPTTGTFGTNINFEAIQEVAIATSGRRRRVRPRSGRDRQHRDQVGHQSRRGFGEVYLPERQLG